MDAPKVDLRIIKACIKCRSGYEAPEGYDLNFQYGQPAICPKCREKDLEEAFKEIKE